MNDKEGCFIRNEQTKDLLLLSRLNLAEIMQQYNSFCNDLILYNKGKITARFNNAFSCGRNTWDSSGRFRSQYLCRNQGLLK